MKKTTNSTRKSVPKKSPKEIMIVNDDPGVETRIAILEDGRLEELYTERTKTATGVGNIYKGQVTNVESAIQAAFKTTKSIKVSLLVSPLMLIGSGLILGLVMLIVYVLLKSNSCIT